MAHHLWAHAGLRFPLSDSVASDGIDLLSTDLIMPIGMNAQELAHKAREMRPTLKALFNSGYSEQFIRARDAENQDIQLFVKPYRRQALA